MFNYINQFIALFVDALKQTGKGKIWLALLAYSAVVVLLLFAFYDHLSPYFYGFTSAFVSLIGGLLGLFGVNASKDEFYHYPNHFLYLPFYFGFAKLIVVILIEGVLLGTSAILFRRAYVRETQALGASFRISAGRWGHLVLLTLIFNAILMLLSAGLPSLLHPWLYGYARRTAAFNYLVLPALYALTLCFFYYTIPLIVNYGQKAFQALGQSTRLFFRNPFTTFFMALVILVGPILFSVIGDNPDVIVSKFYPEMVFWVLLLSLFADIVSNFLWMGTASRFLLSQEQS